jgi:aerobic-type carbon monoxide dehydrogenase small subunit (CoxS/CutS family)
VPRQASPEPPVLGGPDLAALPPVLSDGWDSGPEPEPLDATIFDLRIPSALIAEMPLSGLPIADPPAAVPVPPTGPVASYSLRVNGATHVVEAAWIGENLLHVLRERLGLPGAKEGCGQGVCGTCTVLVDGAPAVSCLVPAAAVGDREVITVEGLAEHGVPTAIQQALIAHGAVQCGFCVPGVVVSAHALLSRVPSPDAATVRRAMAGHPCRCAGPNRMIAAVCAVAEANAEAAEPPASLFDPSGPGTSEEPT